MKNFTSLLTINVIFAIIISTNAQITFSRDWFAGSGKRSAPAMVLHKRPNAVMDNYEMQHVGPAHLQRVPMKRDHQQNGLLTGNHIQDLNRAIEYLQNLKNGLLVQEFGDLEDEAVRIMSKAKGDSTEHSKDNAEYVPRSFSRM